MRLARFPIVVWFCLVSAVGLTACGASSDPAPKPSPSATKPVPVFDKAAVLKAADAHDGAADHVVHECTGCGLMMDGDPAHAHTVDGYELHFCSDSCASRFAEDPERGLSVLSKSLEH